MKHIKAIVLAAGKSTRMKSNKPKVLYTINGVPMISMVINALKSTGIKDIIVVVGHKKELIKKAIKDKVKFVEQNEQLGTAHAVLQAESLLKSFKGALLVINADTPLISSDTIKKLIKEKKDSYISMLTSFVDNPTGYGRIIRNGNELVKKIVEEYDASPLEKQINEINAGIYCFSAVELFDFLKQINQNNAKKEMYITDLIKIVKDAGKKIKPVVVDYNEVIGVDNRERLIEVRRFVNNYEN